VCAQLGICGKIWGQYGIPSDQEAIKSGIVD
jgi:hypothetical protein